MSELGRGRFSGDLGCRLPQVVALVRSGMASVPKLSCEGIVLASAPRVSDHQVQVLCPAGLYLGGLPSLLEVQQIGITHIVVGCVRSMHTSRFPELLRLMPPLQTVLPNLSALHDSPEFSKVLASNYVRLHISLEDADHANLLPRLEEACSCITHALHGGGHVLVHCAAGISRSATASLYLH